MMSAGPTPFTVKGIPDGKGVRIPSTDEIMKMCMDPEMQEALDLAYKADQAEFPEIRNVPSAIKSNIFNMLKHQRETSMVENQNKKVIDEGIRRQKNNEIVY